MHPLLLPLPRLIAYLSFCALLGSLWAIFWMDALNISLIAALIFCIPSAIILGIVSASAFFTVRTNPISSWQKEHTSTHFILKNLYRWLTSSMVISGLWVGMLALWQSLLHSFLWMPAVNGSLIEFAFVSANIIYCINLLVYEIYFSILRSLKAEQTALAATISAREAELSALRNQLDPHFLFNSLNAVSALCVQQPKVAREMTLELAQYFRQTLFLGAQTTINLQQEIELCRHYLNIESLRFGDKLLSSFQIPDELLDHPVPPLIIQPLLENAVKHGISQLTSAGAINVAIAVAGTQLRILVTNSCPAQELSANKAHRGLGLGLNNLRERLQKIYAHNASISTEKSNQCFSVHITLPLRENF